MDSIAARGALPRNPGSFIFITSVGLATGLRCAGSGRWSSALRGHFMKTKRFSRFALATVAAGLLLEGVVARACTSIVVSRKASRDGSVMVTYSADAPFMPRLLRVPGGVHPAGSMVDVRGWENDQVRGQVRQVERHVHGGRPDERAPAFARRDDHGGPARAG